MASLRKASSYSKRKARPYTRKSAKRKKAFIKTIPQNKIVKFNMGDKKGFNEGKFKYVVALVAMEKVQVRDNALEACRTSINKALDKEIPGAYYFAVTVFPHHILRENKSAGGQAGADRLSSGMKHSFGGAIGRAAIVMPGKEIFYVGCVDDRGARTAKDIMARVKPKIPGKTKITFGKKD